MTNSGSLSTTNDADIANAEEAPMFYVVSKRKFAILYLATLGIYSVYWFYKNWDNYKDKWQYDSEANSTIWPVARAIFPYFFVHALFREIKAYAAENPIVVEWRNNLHAWLIAISLFLSAAVDRAANKSIGLPYTGYLSLAFLIPLCFQFIKAQRMINISCGDPDGSSNNSVSVANTAWIVGGAILWILVIAGMLLPDSP